MAGSASPASTGSAIGASCAAAREKGPAAIASGAAAINGAFRVMGPPRLYRTSAQIIGDGSPIVPVQASAEITKRSGFDGAGASAVGPNTVLNDRISAASASFMVAGRPRSTRLVTP